LATPDCSESRRPTSAFAGLGGRRAFAQECPSRSAAPSTGRTSREGGTGRSVRGRGDKEFLFRRATVRRGRPLGPQRTEGGVARGIQRRQNQARGK
jgi:hypothetical protein